MNELIKINYDSDQPTVSGRELHKFLAVETPYSKWFERMCAYGFEERKDYAEVLDKIVQNPLGGRPATDHQLTVPMAKELCMIQRNEKGKLARQYFLSVEEQWNSPDAVMARALRLADRQLLSLKQINSKLTVENQLMAPKAEYFDELVDRNLLTNFRETAKQLTVPPKKFVEWLLEHKYIYRDRRGKLLPYEEKNVGLFEVKECYNDKTQWAGTQTLVTPKGRETFRLLFV